MALSALVALLGPKPMSFIPIVNTQKYSFSHLEYAERGGIEAAGLLHHLLAGHVEHVVLGIVEAQGKLCHLHRETQICIEIQLQEAEREKMAKNDQRHDNFIRSVFISTFDRELFRGIEIQCCGSKYIEFFGLNWIRIHGYVISFEKNVNSFR